MVHEAIEKLVEIFSGIHPPTDAKNVALGETVTVQANQDVTVTFSTERDLEVFVKSIFADRYSGLVYTWRIGGQEVNINEFEFEKGVSLGKSDGEDTAMSLTIENPTSTTRTLDFGISGWGHKR